MHIEQLPKTQMLGNKSASLVHLLPQVIIINSTRMWANAQRDGRKCPAIKVLMVALPNIGGALCSMPQSLADAHYLTAVQ